MLTRSLYSPTEPRLLRPGERIIGSVEGLGIMPEWVIAQDSPPVAARKAPRQRPARLRRHDGRLRKRHRA